MQRVSNRINNITGWRSEAASGVAVIAQQRLLIGIVHFMLTEQSATVIVHMEEVNWIIIQLDVADGRGEVR